MNILRIPPSPLFRAIIAAISVYTQANAQNLMQTDCTNATDNVYQLTMLIGSAEKASMEYSVSNPVLACSYMQRAANAAAQISQIINACGTEAEKIDAEVNARQAAQSMETQCQQ